MLTWINAYNYWVMTHYGPYFVGKDTNTPPKWLGREVNTCKLMPVQIWTMTYEHFMYKRILNMLHYVRWNKLDMFCLDFLIKYYNFV